MGILSPGKDYLFEVHSQVMSKKKPYKVIQEREKAVQVKSDQLAKAIVTCGMPVCYLNKQHEKKRVKELQFKRALIETALTVDANNALILNRKNLMYLDSSERAVISYYVGMFFTKLISEIEYNQQYLIHLNLFERQNTVKYKYQRKSQNNPANAKATNAKKTKPKTRRPDLVGYDVGSGKYSVFEAKGRQRKSTIALQNALEQVLSVKTINGSKPALAIANMTYFAGGKLHDIAADPDNEEGYDIKFDISDYLEEYYSPIIALIEESERKDNERNKVSDIDLGDLAIEIEVPVFIYESYKDLGRDILLEHQYRDIKSDLIGVKLLEK